jgi:hypothetical protein
VKKATAEQRTELIYTVTPLTGGVVFGSPSEIYRTRGMPSRRNHERGPMHLQIGWQGGNGETTDCYVPIAALRHMCAAAANRRLVRAELREPRALNRDAIIAEAREAKAAAQRKRAGA